MAVTQDDFQQFLIANRSSFQRLAYRTRGEIEIEDLYGDAWLLAIEIGEKRGWRVDFTDAVDCDQIMGRLYKRTIWKTDWKMQSAVRIDEQRPDMPSYAETLAGPNTWDPLVQLLRRDIGLDHAARLAHSYSEASAYVRALENFRHDAARLCESLGLSHRALKARFTRAAQIVATQRSLFDGKVRMAKRFVPERMRVYIRKPASPAIHFTQASLRLRHVDVSNSLATMQRIVADGHAVLPITLHFRRRHGRLCPELFGSSCGVQVNRRLPIDPDCIT